MTGLRSADDVPDAEIDADLKTTHLDYDPDEAYPEWGNSALQTAWRAGYEAALAAAQGAAARGDVPTCAWCGIPATGGATSTTDGAVWPSCGQDLHGHDYSPVRPW